LLLEGAKDDAVVAIYDVSGRLVRTLQFPGAALLEWDCRDKQGRDISSGLYFARLKGSSVQAKVVVIR
jgi:hypothetical protein